jgi:hypothetical protein
MARRRPRNDVAFPLSGNVTQTINPWSWWFKCGDVTAPSEAQVSTGSLSG